METLLKDLTYAARGLRKNLGFAAVTTMTIALGIGACTAIFSVVDAVLLRPLPYADAQRLVLIWGELRARKPGSKDEIDGAVRLVRHQVKARIAGSMARTEVDETFANTTDKELEGLWRFPLPEGARLERLAVASRRS